MQTIRPALPLYRDTKKILIDKGISQAAMARELKISRAYLNDILQGKRDGSNYIPRIVDFLYSDVSAMSETG